LNPVKIFPAQALLMPTLPPPSPPAPLPAPLRLAIIIITKINNWSMLLTPGPAGLIGISSADCEPASF